MSRLRFASTVAVAIAALVAPIAIAITPAAPAFAADPAYSVAVATSPKSVPGGGTVRATITVTTNRLDAYADLDLLTIGIDWNPAGGLLLTTAGADAPVGCENFRTPDGSTTSTPTRGGGCDVIPSDVVGGSVQFTYTFTPVGTPPAISTIEAASRFGWFDNGDGYTMIELEPDDLVEVTDYVELSPVFAASVVVDRQIATSGGFELITATFRVRHEPTAAPRMESSQVEYVLTWPAFLQIRSTTVAADDCHDGLVMSFGGATCFIHEPDSTRKDTTFDIVFEASPGAFGQGAISMYGMGGWYVPETIISFAPGAPRAPGAPEEPRTSLAAVGAPRPIGAPPVRLQVPEPDGALDIPSTWTGLDSVSVLVDEEPFPMTLDLQPTVSTNGSERIEGVIGLSHDPTSVTMPGLEIDLTIEFDSDLVLVGEPAGCASYTAGICTVTGLDAPGASTEITLEFEPPPESGWHWVDVGQVAARFVFDGTTVEAPGPWLTWAYDSVLTDAELVTLDVELLDDHVWTDGPYLGALITVTRAERGGDGDLYDDLLAGIELSWPAYLTPVADPSGCETWDGTVCEVRLAEPGPENAELIQITFAIGPGVTEGVVRAEGVTLTELDYYGQETLELLPEWIIPDEETVRGIDPFITIDVAVERELVWPTAPDLPARILVTRDPIDPDLEREPFGELVLDIAITWPAFLDATGPPTGCESWDGAICEVLLEGPGSTAVIDLGFEVLGAGAPAVSGVVRAEGTALAVVDGDYSQDLPIEWVVPDEEPVTCIEAEIGVELSLDHSPGYTGGKQLVATVTVSREAGGAVLPGLEVDLRFTWPSFLTKVADSGCAAWDVATATCTVTGLAQPGASAQVVLRFSMPPPTFPAPSPVPPRDGDVTVAGMRLEFDAPPSTSWPEPPEPAEPPAEADGTLPTAWIGSDRTPFRLLQPSIVVAPSVSTTGEAVGAYAVDLPPGARIELRWGDGTPADLPGVVRAAEPGQTNARLPVFVLRWQILGERTLVMHNPDGLFGDIRSANTLLLVPRSAMAPNLLGRGG